MTLLLRKKRSRYLHIYVATDNATMVSAAAAAVAGDLIKVSANITATTLGTTLPIAAGVTIGTDGTARTVAGFKFRCWSAGNYTPTRFLSGLTINGTGANAGSTQSGTIEMKEGVFEFWARVTGANGGAGRPANNITLFDSASYKAVLDFYGQSDNAQADCVSAVGYGDASNIHHPDSRMTAKAGNVIFKPGTGGSDNWFTSHGGLPCYAEGGTWSQPGGGPVVNSAPANATMELYGVDMDVTGVTNGSLNALAMAATKIVGCKIHGTPADATVEVRLMGDANKPTEQSVFLASESSLHVSVGSGHLLQPIIYRGQITAADKWIGDSLSATQHQTIGAVAAKCTLAGPVTATVAGFYPAQTWTVFNFTIDVPASPAVNAYPVRARTPFDASTNTTDIKAFLINQSGRAIDYAVRSDSTRQAMTVTDSVTTAGTNVSFPTTLTKTNCTQNGSSNGVSVGASGACAALVAHSVYGLENYMAANAGKTIGQPGWSQNPLSYLA